MDKKIIFFMVIIAIIFFLLGTLSINYYYSKKLDRIRDNLIKSRKLNIEFKNINQSNEKTIDQLSKQVNNFREKNKYQSNYIKQLFAINREKNKILETNSGKIQSIANKLKAENRKAIAIIQSIKSQNKQ